MLTIQSYVAAVLKTWWVLVKIASLPNVEPQKTMLKWIWLAVLVLIFDQVSKQLVILSMELYESIQVSPFFQLTYVRNQGAAFSFLSQAGGWQRWFFVILSVVASVVIIGWLSRMPSDQRWQAAALALVLGGAVGNLVDRIRHGFVVDFLDVYYGSWHWPAFNVADSAITVGVVLLLIDSLKTGKDSGN